MRTQDGLTFIEFLVTLALVGLALGAIAGMAQGTFRTLALTDRTLEVQQSARVAVDRMVEELRWAEEVLDDPGCGGLCPDRISVRVSPHNPRRPGEAYVITFERDQVQRELERRLGRGVNNLAGSIERVAFRYFDAWGRAADDPREVMRVEVEVTASSTSTSPPTARSVATGVFLRNHPRPSPTP